MYSRCFSLTDILSQIHTGKTKYAIDWEVKFTLNITTYSVKLIYKSYWFIPIRHASSSFIFILIFIHTQLLSRNDGLCERALRGDTGLGERAEREKMRKGKTVYISLRVRVCVCESE